MNGNNPTPARRTKMIPRLSQGGYSREDVAKRRAWVQQQTSADLNVIGRSEVCPTTMRGNIENPIGTVQVPLGGAGPLEILGQHAQGTFYVPLATTEGALVRSYERGMLTISKSGGATVRIVDDGNTASPIFTCADVAMAVELATLVTDGFAELKRLAEATTQHGTLRSATPRLLGRDVVVDFRYMTGDAHGMNMITKATHAACQWIHSQFPVEKSYAMSGASGEKRAASTLLRGGKGKYVTAGVRLSTRLTQTYLNLTPTQFVDLWRRTVVAQLGSGVMGYNGHFANGLTALFLATGQDVANVVNSAVGVNGSEKTISTFR